MVTAISEHRYELTPEQLVSDYRTYKGQRLHGRSLATANWVTTLAHECEAYGVFMRTVPAEKRLLMKESLGMVFSEGDDQARAIKRDLLDMGYEVEGAEGQMSWGAFQITGRQDLKIRRQGARHSIYAEIKSCSQYSYDSVNSVDDMQSHKWMYVRKWYAQVCLYMLLRAVEKYWVILKNKQTGQIKIIVFEMDANAWAAADAMVEKAKRINEFVHIGKMPTPEMKIEEPSLCQECEMFPVCNPSLNFGTAATILDEELAAELSSRTARILELKPLAKEYEDLDDEVKSTVKSLCSTSGSSQVVYGDYIANVKDVQIKGVPEKLVPAKPAYVQKRVSFQATGGASGSNSALPNP